MSDKSGFFSQFTKLCEDILANASYTAKTQIIKEFVQKFTGDLKILFKFLLVKEADRRIYNLKEKQMAKILSRIFSSTSSLDEITTSLNKNDMPITIRETFKKSGKAKAKSQATLKQIDDLLNELNGQTTEDNQLEVMKKIFDQTSPEDIYWIWKLIDHDLKINIGAKFAMAALHEKAFPQYQKTNNLNQIIELYEKNQLGKKDTTSKKKLEKTGSDFGGGMTLMSPVRPMLAKATKDLKTAFKLCPNEIYAEIKYDGERIQIHKQGKEFKFFSRNLKPMTETKVDWIRDWIPKCTSADSIVLDGEILLMDTVNHKPLPFGTLGVHKKKGFKDATVCVFLFDILYLNGKTLLDTPLKERRKLLEKTVSRVEDRVEYSELIKTRDEKELADLIVRAINQNLEGLVVKDSLGVYEPSARHWGKIKKDYLSIDMADAADLIVLGGYWGTGKMAGKIASFLMGVHDPKTKKFMTVTKVANGFDDQTIDELQQSLVTKMVDIKGDFSRVPAWLNVNRIHVPDYIAKDPKKMPVWEIIGTEFLESVHHTANAISIRFPRLNKMRSDKEWSEATNLQELIDLTIESKKKTTGSDFLFQDKGKKPKKSTEATDSDKEKPKKKQPLPVTKVSNNNNETTTWKESPSVEEEFPPNTKPLTPAQLGYFHEVVGDVTFPQGEGGKLIINVADTSGNWPSNRGLFAAISKRWSSPEEGFKKLPLADVQFFQVEEDIHVATVIALQPHTGHQRHFYPASFRKALYGMTQYILKGNLSVHIPQLGVSKIPGLKWSQVQQDLAHYLPAIHIYVYNLAGSKGSSVLSGAPVKRVPQEDPKAKTKQLKLERQVDEDEDFMSREGTSAESSPFRVTSPRHADSSEPEEQLFFSRREKGKKELHLLSSDEENNLQDADKTQPMDLDEYPDLGGDSEATEEATEPSTIPAIFREIVVFLYDLENLENLDQLTRCLKIFGAAITIDPTAASVVLCPENTSWTTEFSEWLHANSSLKILSDLWAWNSINLRSKERFSSYFIPKVK